MYFTNMNSDFNKKIGFRLASFRQASGKTQCQLAELLDITQPTLASYETGRRTLPLELLVPVAQLLEISINQILQETPEEFKKPGPLSQLEKQVLKVKDLPKSEQKYVSLFLDQVISSATATH